jgi:hypothetical protein
MSRRGRCGGADDALRRVMPRRGIMRHAERCAARDDAAVVSPGLCATCVHAARVTGARSQFWMCRRHATDPSFPRYPSLPVLSCRGYEPPRKPEAISDSPSRSEMS